MSDEPMELGSITISYLMYPDGDMGTGVSIDGDIPLVVQLGLLRMTEDTILCMEEDDDDD